MKEKKKINFPSAVRSFFLVIYITILLIEIIELIKAPHEIALRNNEITSMSGYMQVMITIFAIAFFNGLTLLPVYIFSLKDFFKYLVYLIISIVILFIEIDTNLYDYVLVFLIILNLMQFTLIYLKYKDFFKKLFIKK